MPRISALIVVVPTAIVFVVSSSHGRAQGFVEHFEPPVLERGKTTRVTVIGTQLGKPVGLWTSLSADAVKATPIGQQTANRVMLDVAVAADAPVGICGVRLATEDGLGNACLMLIDDLPVRPAVAGKTMLPVALWGRFREANVDRFAIEVSRGQTVSFEAVGNRLGKDVDPLVTIRDARGKVVAERDNDPGLYFDCRFEHTFAEAGTYTVEMRDARFHGHEHGMYVLRMGKFPAERVAVPTAVRGGKATGLFFGVRKRPGDDGSTWVPLEATDGDVTLHQTPGNTIDNGTLAKVPAMLCGVLQKPGERHFFRLDLTKGQRIQVRAEARAFNSPADLEIAITDAKGKELRRAGENAQEEVVLDFNAGAPGVYGLTVRDVNHDGGPAFGYRIDVRTPQPRVNVMAEVEGLSVPRGDYQPIPLTVTRSDFTGKIALALVGAPAGVTLTPNEIPEGTSAIVCQLAAAAKTPVGVFTFQMIAAPVANALDAPTLVRTRPLIDKQIVNVDLIPHALREDQRRLPPSLTDRFAMQVTPPSFFTFQLPEKLVTLGRYQHVEFPINLTRTKGFDGALTFSARGGQIAPKEEGRTRVYAEFAKDKGSIHSKILTNLARHRVEVTAVGVQGNRRISLTRAFELDIRAAFVVTAEPALLKLEAGASAKLRLNAERMKTFDGDVAVQISPALGIELPTTVLIPRGKTGVDIAIKVDPSRAPGRQTIQLNATAEVNGFEEEQRGRFEVEIVKTAPPKK
jgi:hypothetical protein